MVKVDREARQRSRAETGTQRWQPGRYTLCWDYDAVGSLGEFLNRRSIYSARDFIAPHRRSPRLALFIVFLEQGRGERPPAGVAS